MNTFKLLFTIAAALVVSVSAHANRTGKPTEGKVEIREVDNLERVFSEIGLSTTKATGLRMLAEVRPELRTLLESVSKKLKENAAQTAITANKPQFDELVRNIDAASAQAAEARVTRVQYTGSSAKLLEAIEALPGVLAEVAAGGPKADVQKAVDVARILADVTNAKLSNEADALLVIKTLEDRLGTSKDGRKITLDDLIRRCLDMMRRGQV